MKEVSTKFKRLVLLTIIVFPVVTGCTWRYVADYDATVVEEINRISKKVDVFYGKLLETPADERGYQRFKDTYIDIEADLRLLLRRNEIRPLNTETTQQITTTLNLWLEDKAKHEKNDTVSDFIAKKHREQFCRLFVAMAKGEIAKDV